MTFGQCESDSVGQPLTEWARRHFDSGSVTSFGVTGCPGAPLAERSEVVHLDARTLQEEERVLKDRGMPRRQNESVAVEPFGIGRIGLQDTRKQNVAKWSERHRRSLVAALGREGCIHGQTTNEGDCGPIDLRGEAGQVGHEFDCTSSATAEPFHAGGRRVNGTMVHGPRSTRQWA